MEQHAGKVREQEPCAPTELDYLYNEIDKLYHTFAHGCGISDCAYWMLYGLELGGGSLPVSTLTKTWSYSKQTINSALKALEGRGLVSLTYMEGSRKNKRAELTEAGRAFSEARIVPAIDAEHRAFATLTPEERVELVRLVRRYVDALDAEIGAAATGLEDVSAQVALSVHAAAGLWDDRPGCAATHDAESNASVP